MTRTRRGRAPVPRKAKAQVAAKSTALLAVSCWVCAPIEAAPIPAAYQQQWTLSDQQLKEARSADAYRARLALIESPYFDSLPEEQRHERLLNTGFLGLDVEDFASAYRLLVRSSEMPQPRFGDWAGRMLAAYGLSHTDDAVRALHELLKGWSGQLSHLPAPIVRSLAASPAESEAQRTARFELRLALYQASFRGDYGESPDELWSRLARDLIERNRSAEALKVVATVNSPRSIMSMRIDRRFADLLRQAPARFDVKAAAERQIRDREEAVLRFPRKINAIVQLCGAYLDAGRYKDVLRVSRAVLARVDDPETFSAAYDDDETALNWLLDVYARAAIAMKRPDEAMRALEMAAEGLEHGNLNVSNVINLGSFYADLGDGHKAQRVLAQISEADSQRLMSAYGLMQWYGARQMAALAQGDAVQAGSALDYLRTHQADAIGTYQEGLVRAGLLDEAAHLLIARLRDPQRSLEALKEIQIYDSPPTLPGLVLLRSRWRTVVSRHDVQQAVAQVGRIERIPIPPDPGY